MMRSRRCEKPIGRCPRFSRPIKRASRAAWRKSAALAAVGFVRISGPALGAHFHGPGEAGKNAGIALPFKLAQSPIEGMATLTEGQAADLLSGVVCEHPYRGQSW